MLLWFRKFSSGHPYGVARKGCGAHGYLYSTVGGNFQGWEPRNLVTVPHENLKHQEPKDSVWEDWGTLGNIREPPPIGPPAPEQPFLQRIWKFEPEKKQGFLGGGFYFFFEFSPLPGEIIRFDYSNIIFELGWNHQLGICSKKTATIDCWCIDFGGLH